MVACFLRVDLEVSGQPSGDLYDVISDKLQDLLMDGLEGPSAPVTFLRASTCRVLGPLADEDELANNVEPGTEFDILIGHLEWEAEEDEED